MTWEDCVEEAKDELGVSGFVSKTRWQEVVDLAKELFWKSDDWKEEKQSCIDDFENECQLCGSDNVKLTAHHICYGDNQELIAVCNDCHRLIHDCLNKWGFIAQCYFTHEFNNDFKIPDNMARMCMKVMLYIEDELEKRLNNNIYK